MLESKKSSYDVQPYPRLPFARSQSRLGPGVTSLSHHNVVLSEIDRLVLQSLDGATPVSEVAFQVQSAMRERRFAPVDAIALQETIDASITNLTRMRLVLHRSD